ncbi:MAG: transglycosylase SLT domain-containing protein [Cytophagaceae bacterium]|jgi:membrane-bound lytic murein transglycosylase F|nr:transglycosylase SLT domain-containing protein [Cytophagaceae bacterium]
MKLKYFILIISIVGSSCSSSKEKEPTKLVDALFLNKDTSIHTSVVREVSITDPFKSKRIKLLITNHFNTYYIYKGQEFGLEFELLQLYLKDKGWELELELIHDMTHIQDSILSRGTHMAAASFVFPAYGDADGLYSNAIYTTDLVLVQNKEKSITIPTVHTPVTATIVREAPFITKFFKDSLEPRGIQYQLLEKGTTKQELVEEVAKKNIEATICSRNEADIMSTFYPSLSYETVVVNQAAISFLFHPKCKTLQIDFNQWLKKKQNTSDYCWIIKTYESLPKEIKKNVKYITPVVLKERISKYDTLVQYHSKKIGWNWKLVSAIIFQESQFNPHSVSWVGAKGLMQVMPSVGKEYGQLKPTQLFIPEKNIDVGTKYLAWIQKYFYNEKVIAPEDKLKFIIASYNAGVGHVADARALASKHGLNPNKWDNHVEKMMLVKSYPKYYQDPVCKYGYCRGLETTTYVDNIMGYYNHYLKYIP